MNYSMTILEEHHAHLSELIFGIAGCEGAAFLRCGISHTPHETRFLVRSVEAVRAEEYLVREPLRLSIASTAYARVAKRADGDGEGIIFVHSHPTGIVRFSPQDDREEPKLMRFLQSRLGVDVPVGSLVISSRPSHCGRVWVDGGWEPMSVMRVIGQRFKFLGLDPATDPLPQFFDRQIRAFGEDVQRVLRHLRVGIVGVGGTGSAMVEQLARLGVGALYVFDGDTFDSTNVNRVYGSRADDANRKKTDIQRDSIERIDLGTEVAVVPIHITKREAALRLRECDVVFGCTDKERPRGILTALVTRYLMPVIDMGVIVLSKQQQLDGVFGRVTTLLPGESCLFCRGRISPEHIAAEGLYPELRNRLFEEGYAPELEDNAPAVIPFTTAVAAQAVTELLHRLTGFMGLDRVSSEVLLFMHSSEIRTNRIPRNPDCVCADRRLWGRGDEREYLGLMWS